MAYPIPVEDPNAPVDQAIRVAMRFQQHTQERAHVMHVYVPEGAPAFRLQDAANAFMTWWQNYYRQYCVDDLVLQDITATDLSEELQSQYVLPCTSNCAGVSASAPAPGNVTSTISWRTQFAGRAFRGRSFMAGYADGDTADDDTITPQRVNALTTIGLALIGILVSDDLNLAVLSRRYGTIAPIISLVVENVLDSMRRRLPKRGA